MTDPDASSKVRIGPCVAGLVFLTARATSTKDPLAIFRVPAKAVHGVER